MTTKAMLGSDSHGSDSHGSGLHTADLNDASSHADDSKEMSSTNPRQYRLACLLLAAGEAKRFGSAKQLLAFQGKTLVENVLHEMSSASALSGLSATRFFVALGGHQKSIKLVLQPALLNDLVTLIDIQQWQLGMGHSLAESVTHIAPFSFTHLLVALADQVALRAQDFTALIQHSVAHPTCIIASQFSQKMSLKHKGEPKSTTAFSGIKRKTCEINGAPAIFPAHYFPELMQLQGDTGARKVISQSNAVVGVPLPNAAIDIDTPEEWCFWKNKRTGKI